MASPLLSCVLALPRAECRFQAVMTSMTSMTSMILALISVLSLCNICCADLKDVQTGPKSSNPDGHGTWMYCCQRTGRRPIPKTYGTLLSRPIDMTCTGSTNETTVAAVIRQHCSTCSVTPVQLVVVYQVAGMQQYRYVILVYSMALQYNSPKTSYLYTDTRHFAPRAASAAHYARSQGRIKNASEADGEIYDCRCKLAT